MPKFRKKLMIQFLENAGTDGRVGRPSFIGYNMKRVLDEKSAT